jgi:hypothetical protein
MLIFISMIFQVRAPGAEDSCAVSREFLPFNVEAAELNTRFEGSFATSCTEYYSYLLDTADTKELCGVIESGVVGLSDQSLESLVKKRMKAMLPYLEERTQWHPVQLSKHLLEPFHALMGLLRFVPDCKRKTDTMNQGFCEKFFTEQLMNVKFLLRDYQDTSSAVGFFLFLKGLTDFGLPLREAMLFVEKNYLFRYVHASGAEDWIRHWSPESDARFVAPILELENLVVAGVVNPDTTARFQLYIDYLTKVWADPLGPLNGRSALAAVAGS